MNSIPFVRSNAGNITAYLKNRVVEIGPDHPGYEKAKAAIRAGDEAGFLRVADVASSLKRFSRGRVTVDNGVVSYNGEAVNNVICERIVTLMRENLPFEPMVKFLDNLMLNPSKRSIDELYKFLEHFHLPITDDGCFLAYKRVKDNWTDCHTGKINNSIGTVVTMDRNKVDDNLNNGCSAGLHVGAIEYVRTFMTGGHVIIVKVNPRDVVSVPLDCNCTKLRCCRYEVMYEYTGDLVSPLYDSAGQTYTSNDEYDNDTWQDDDTDWDEEDDEDDDWDDEEDDEVCDNEECELCGGGFRDEYDN